MCMCPCTVLYLASSHPVAFVQSKLPQSSGPPNAEPQMPQKAPAALGLPAQRFKVEQTDTVITGTAAATVHNSSLDSVTFEPNRVGQATTISADALHALVEQLRPSQPAQSVQEILIIHTLDNAAATEAAAPQRE